MEVVMNKLKELGIIKDPEPEISYLSKINGSVDISFTTADEQAYFELGYHLKRQIQGEVESFKVEKHKDGRVIKTKLE